MGVIQWLKKRLLDPELYESGTTLLPPIIVLMREIVRRQELQRADVLDLIIATVPVVGNRFSQFTQSLMDIGAEMLVRGEVALFCSFCAALIQQQIDRSFTRHMLVHVLKMVEEPYTSDAFSPAVAATLVGLTLASGVESREVAMREQNARIFRFLSACKGVDFSDHALTPEGAKLIAEIRSG